MNSTAFKIIGLDCAEEVATLKREIGPLIANLPRSSPDNSPPDASSPDGVSLLVFDILQGKMKIDAPCDAACIERIRSAVAATGMKAIPWTEWVASQAEGKSATLWERRGRTIMCSVSAACIALGFTIHAVTSRSVMAALTGGEAGAGTETTAFTNDAGASFLTGAFAGYPEASVLFYLIAILSGIWFVIPKAVYAARKIAPDMNLLMFVAVWGAMFIGEWFEAAMVAFLFAVANLLESWSVGRARRAIRALVDLSPATARTRCGGDDDEVQKPVDEVAIGSTVIIRAGEKIALDGEITKGETSIDQAPITGESMPVERGPGDEVFAGTINMEATIEITTTRAASDTTLARITRMVEEAHARRAPSEKWVERFARVYTPVMMLMAALVAVVPPLLLGGEAGEWLYRSLVLLVIACPCALVISTPVTVVAGLAAAAQQGVLIKGGVFLELPARIDALAFDKTGTLTHGRPEVSRVVALNEHTPAELLERAAALESESLHPLARAIIRKAAEENLIAPAVEDYRLIPGKGAEATIDGRRFWIGSHRYVHDLGAEETGFHELACEIEDEGNSLVVIGNDRHICGAIGIADSIRNNAASTMRELKSLGVQTTIMLTGDNERAAALVARSVGVDEFRAELLPEEKVQAIRELGARYDVVAMVGDGINDAPAMASADLGIAMGAAGADAAIECADIALMSDDLSRIAWLVRHSRRVVRTIRWNIAFALGLKAVFVLLAVAGYATLWMAIAADMGASLLVIGNGLRMLKA